MIMTRIQGFSMGYSDFQKPIIQNPRLRGIFEFQDFSLAAGSPSGGADGGGAAPAPAPAPGADQTGFGPSFLFPVQQQPGAVPAPTTITLPAMPQIPTSLPTPTWAIVGGALLVGIAVGVFVL